MRQIELAKKDDKEGIRAIARRVMSLATIYDHLLGPRLRPDDRLCRLPAIALRQSQGFSRRKARSKSS